MNNYIKGIVLPHGSKSLYENSTDWIVNDERKIFLVAAIEKPLILKPLATNNFTKIPTGLSIPIPSCARIHIRSIRTVRNVFDGDFPLIDTINKDLFIFPTPIVDETKNFEMNVNLKNIGKTEILIEPNRVLGVLELLFPIKNVMWKFKQSDVNFLNSSDFEKLPQKEMLVKSDQSLQTRNLLSQPYKWNIENNLSDSQPLNVFESRTNGGQQNIETKSLFGSQGKIINSFGQSARTIIFGSQMSNVPSSQPSNNFGTNNVSFRQSSLPHNNSLQTNMFGSPKPNGFTTFGQFSTTNSFGAKNNLFGQTSQANTFGQIQTLKANSFCQPASPQTLQANNFNDKKFSFGQFAQNNSSRGFGLDVGQTMPPQQKHVSQCFGTDVVQNAPFINNKFAFLSSSTSREPIQTKPFKSCITLPRHEKLEPFLTCMTIPSFQNVNATPVQTKPFRSCETPNMNPTSLQSVPYPSCERYDFKNSLYSVDPPSHASNWPNSDNSTQSKNDLSLKDKNTNVTFVWNRVLDPGDIIDVNFSPNAAAIAHFANMDGSLKVVKKSAYIDLFANVHLRIDPLKIVAIPTGVSVEFPSRQMLLQVWNVKTVKENFSVFDEGPPVKNVNNEISVHLINHGAEPIYISRGEKIGRLVALEIPMDLENRKNNN